MNRLLPALLITLLLAPVAHGALPESNSEEEQLSVTEGYATPPAAGFNAARSVEKRHVTDDRWFDIFNVEVELYDDFDRNGYFSAFEIAFDVDVEYGNAWVYADIWIRRSGSYYELLHQTDTFMISGSASDDVYIVNAELLTHYPPDYYDVMIELYNADSYSGSPVVIADYGYHHALSSLPLESRRHSHGSGSVTVVAHGAGVTSWLTGVFMLLLSLRLRKKN